MQIGPWRATYSPGRWVLLAGPTTMAVLQPAGPQHSDLITSIWEGILDSADIHAVAGTLSRFGLDQMPSLAIVFWSEDGMRSLVRGDVRVIDPASGRVIADGADVQTWSELGLGDLRQVAIETSEADGRAEALELPLAVGGAQVSRVLLDARPVSSVQKPPAEESSDLGAASAAAASPAVAGFAATQTIGDRPGMDDQAAEAEADKAAEEDERPEDRMDPTEPLQAEDVPQPIGEETPFDDADVSDQTEDTGSFDQHDVLGAGAVSEVGATSQSGDERPVPLGDVESAGGGDDGAGDDGAGDVGDAQAAAAPTTEDYEAMDFEESASEEGAAQPDEPAQDAREQNAPAADAPDADAQDADAPADVAPAVQPSLENDTEVMPAVGSEGPAQSAPSFTPASTPNGSYGTPQAVPGTEPAGLVESTPGQTQQISNQAEPLPTVPPPAPESPAPEPSAPEPSAPEPPAAPMLRPSHGQAVPLDRPVVIGRAPKPQPGLDNPALLTVQSPSHDISRTHAQVVPDGEVLRVTDLHSTNGTILIRNGEFRKERLTPGEAVPVQVGDIIDLGDGVTVTVDPPR